MQGASAGAPVRSVWSAVMQARVHQTRSARQQVIAGKDSRVGAGFERRGVSPDGIDVDSRCSELSSSCWRHGGG